jgi:hypothetical protein
MSIVLNGTTGITFPASNTPSFTSYQGGVITSGTAVASTSGTSIDFTSIPSWVKRITVMLSGVSTSGTSPLAVQIGDGSIATTGYAGSVGTTGAQTGAGLWPTTYMAATVSSVAAMTMTGTVILNLVGSNVWVSSGIVAFSATDRSAHVSGFTKTLSTSLDRVRITTGGGTDTFDAGSINILYE